MTVRIIALDELTADDVAMWDSLSQRAVESNPFLDPAFLVPVAAAWPEATDLCLAVLEVGERWEALFAFTIEAIVAARVRIPVMSLAGPFLSGATGRQHPLVAADNPRGHLDALLKGLRAKPLPRILELGFFPADGPLHDALNEVAQGRGVRRVAGEAVDVAYANPGPVAYGAPAAGDALIRGDHLSASRRKMLRKMLHGIEHQTSTTVMHRDRSRDSGAVREFIALQASGWKGDADRGGAAIALRPGYAEGFERAAENLRREGRWRLDALVAGGQTVHMYTAIRARSGGWFGVLDAYDERFINRKPGQLGRLTALLAVRADFPEDAYDPCLGSHYEADFALYPDRRPMAYVSLSYGGARSAAMLRSVPLLRRAGGAWSSVKGRLKR